jgi:hypothetical protein
MSHRVVVFASALALTAGGLLGCGPTGSGTSATTRATAVDRTAAPATSKERDIQVRTPGANVDVHRDADGRAKVDVQTRDRGTGR